MFLYISVQLSFFFVFCSPPSASRHLRLGEGRSLVSFGIGGNDFLFVDGKTNAPPHGGAWYCMEVFFYLL